VSNLRWVAAVGVLVLAAPPAPAVAHVFHASTREQVNDLNRALTGTVLDYTANHGADRRIWSAALGRKRDVYVYLPPGYDGRTPFPVMFWFHGLEQDEKDFLSAVPYFDREIAAGRMPPFVIVCPDGSIKGRPSFLRAGSFYLNTDAGRFEDYVMQDVWGFVRRTFAIHPDRGAHVMAGGSMGGFAAYNLGIKYRAEFRVLVGVLPPLNLRYVNCRGQYFAPYDPNCVAFRQEFRPREVIGRFYGVIKVRSGRVIAPLVGVRNPNAMQIVARENPIEMLAAYDVRPGECAMFVGYGDQDEFNIHAQCRHFLDVARGRGLAVTAVEVPGGRHSTETGVQMLPALAEFLTREVGAFTPPGYRPPGALPYSATDPGPKKRHRAGGSR
jgi:S-formylglutathione hydrolase FrmB